MTHDRTSDEIAADLVGTPPPEIATLIAALRDTLNGAARGIAVEAEEEEDPVLSKLLALVAQNVQTNADLLQIYLLYKTETF